jgi:RNA polymerase-interacting CarD/CdnL/TRCF family regulator
VTLIVGNKVSYPSQGPCLIGAVVKRIIDDRPMMFYQLLVLNNGGGNLFIPVDNVHTIGIRALLKKSEIPKLLDRLKQPTQAADTSRQRALDNQKLFASGSAFALAEVAEALTELRETQSLSFGEHKVLERAKRLLICEISQVMGESEEEAERQVEQALKARNR